MNCIDESLFQKYIDHECTDVERKEIKHHLALCESCRVSLVEKENISIAIKRAVNSLNIQDSRIPAFDHRVKNKRNKIKLFIYSLSAACILLLVLFVVEKQMEPNHNEITIVQSIPLEVDANRPASDQDLVIEVYDGKGQRTEYLIE